MSHRGPDESGVHVTKKDYVLSHERLAVLDPETGKQSIQGISTAWIIYNGEIYNHQVLRNNELKIIILELKETQM